MSLIHIVTYRENISPSWFLEGFFDDYSYVESPYEKTLCLLQSLIKVSLKNICISKSHDLEIQYAQNIFFGMYLRVLFDG